MSNAGSYICLVAMALAPSGTQTEEPCQQQISKMNLMSAKFRGWGLMRLGS